MSSGEGEFEGEEREVTESVQPTSVDERPVWRQWLLPVTLIALTFLSTFYVGAGMVERPTGAPVRLIEGAAFALPLMAILLAHEFGHFIAGRIHGVDISPPYFIPAPIFLLGTMGAVIRMRGPIRSRNALLDVGAAGPLAGFAIALPVLIYGLMHSPIRPLPTEGNYIMEGRSLLYLALLHITHGSIGEGRDVFLNPTAFAGWAGMLVTMINLLPIGQLDGGHVAYALFGKRQDTWSERLRKSLPLIAVVVSASYALPAYLAGARGDKLLHEALAGVHWLTWAFFLWIISLRAGKKHPPTRAEPLTPSRRIIAMVTLVIFVLLFMPSWVREQ